ncbi:hypothetical protein HF675_00840 [Serratia sp. JUb9]|uniref:Uncharacterized protein n=1 Tax=Serratia rhizosphaerae TaxID=2597702 RepID=A0ABX6GMI8_9GAMM|nr:MULTISPECIES: hypothetical protein [Serratia]MBU3894030.1 hypothetical protein [Serratia rubidaea]AVJ19752.1 hypothetical protein CLM71_22665 [Serratia sp. MYb239]MCA4823562.1 hypothetical protein [Serratia rubidaea]QHA87440.1 hypothetical protein FO014_11045 [Serratia rhizosphaerae]QNK32650.1 hypothetical protein HF675_00840 [Serratia sp. JUb9]
MWFYYILSALVALFFLSIKLKYRPTDNKLPATILMIVGWVLATWQFIIFANGRALFITDSTQWISDNWLLRYSALAFAIIHIIATFEFKAKKR